MANRNSMKRKRAMGSKSVQSTDPEQFQRIRLPKGEECFGIVEQRLGGNRMSVRCLDGNTRNCRIPGRLKKSLWVREGDIIIIEPWEFAKDTKGDVVFKYRPNQASYIKKQGYLRAIEDLDEF